MAAIETPCEKICIVDQPSGLCRGCGRSLAEIERWTAYSDGERARIMAELPQRLEAMNARTGSGPTRMIAVRRRLLWVLLIGVALALVVMIARHDEDPIAGLAADDWGALAYHLALVVFIGGAVLVLFRERLSTALEAALFWVVVGFVLVFGYTYRGELRDIGERVMAELMPGRAAHAQRAHGRDRARARRRFPGGGADQRRARRHGARHRRERRRADPGGRQGRRPAARVAVLYGAGRHRERPRPRRAVTLDRLAVGGIVERSVPALIAQPGQLRTSLLGMSFLNRLESWEVRGDKLMMRGKP